MTLSVLCVTPEASGGWAPVTTMAQLAARLFGGRLFFHHPTSTYGRLTQALSMVPPLRGGDEHLLVIAAHPGSLLSLAEWPMLRRRFATVSAWIIDDFWDEWIPRFTRTWDAFEQVWITDAELVDLYGDRMKSPVACLPWGADTLHPALLGADEARATSTAADDRTLDVLRLGRQPDAFNDDDANRTFFEARGLTYSGRFPAQPTAEQNQVTVLGLLRSAKVVLASAPTASPEDYTHRSRDYITARWTDAAAAGAIVVGRQPRCEAAELLPAEGLIDVDVASPSAAAAVVDAVGRWSLERALRIQRHARAELDWRWRFVAIAERLSVASSALDLELGRLHGGAPHAG